MRIKNLPSISSMDGSQDALIIEQTDGSEDKSRKVSPAQIKQYVLGNSIDDIYSVMGQMGAKNLIPYPFKDITKTVNGITFTDNGDGTITVSGTASANATFNIRDIWTASDLVELLPNTIYAFSGCPVGGSVSTYLIQFVNEESNLSNKSWLDDIGTGGTITTTDVKRFVGARIVIQSGTVFSTPVTFKPMLRLAADTDNTYQPYAKTNRQLTEDKAELASVRDYVNELGVKNLIPYPYYETTKTVNGVTFTDNGDGTVTVSTESGGATATAQFGLASRINSHFYLPNGTYIVTGCPNTTGCQIRVGRTVNNADSQYGQDTGSGLTFTRTDATNAIGIALQIASGTIITTPITFKPMLRLASDINDDTYVPYAMTNKQLTDEIQRILSRL